MKRSKSRSISQHLFKVDSSFGPKKKPLYIKNMEYLIKKAKEKSKLKKFFNMHLDLKKKLSGYSIPSNLYYMTKMLKSLLKINKQNQLNKNFLEHFSLNCQSCLYLKKIKQPSIEDLASKKVRLPSIDSSKKKF